MLFGLFTSAEEKQEQEQLIQFVADAIRLFLPILYHFSKKQNSIKGSVQRRASAADQELDEIEKKLNAQDKGKFEEEKKALKKNSSYNEEHNIGTACEQAAKYILTLKFITNQQRYFNYMRLAKKQAQFLEAIQAALIEVSRKKENDDRSAEYMSIIAFTATFIKISTQAPFSENPSRKRRADTLTDSMCETLHQDGSILTDDELADPSGIAQSKRLFISVKSINNSTLGNIPHSPTSIPLNENLDQRYLKTSDKDDLSIDNHRNLKAAKSLYRKKLEYRGALQKVKVIPQSSAENAKKEARTKKVDIKSLSAYEKLRQKAEALAPISPILSFLYSSTRREKCRQLFALLNTLSSSNKTLSEHIDAVSPYSKYGKKAGEQAIENSIFYENRSIFWKKAKPETSTLVEDVHQSLLETQRLFTAGAGAAA